MTLLLDILTTSIILYGVAAGLLIIFGVMKIINFAHGALLTVGGYAALLVTMWGLNPWWALPCAFVIGALCGMVIERLVMRPLYSRPLDAILATWGLGIVIGQCITLAIGRGVQFVSSPVTGAVSIFGTSYSEYRLLLVPVVLGVVAALGWLAPVTRRGLGKRTDINNEEMARRPSNNSTVGLFSR